MMCVIALICMYLLIRDPNAVVTFCLCLPLPQDCAVCGQACRAMIPHEVRRTRPPVVLGDSSRCDVVTLSPATLSSPYSR